MHQYIFLACRIIFELSLFNTFYQGFGSRRKIQHASTFRQYGTLAAALIYIQTVWHVNGALDYIQTVWHASGAPDYPQGDTRRTSAWSKTANVRATLIDYQL